MNIETHITVMPEETIQILELKKGMNVFEGTLGNGGHSIRICEKIGPTGTLVATDLDQRAIDEARKHLAENECRSQIFIHRMNFRELDQALILSGIPVGELDGAVFDLGLRTEQLFDSGRGFSFHEPDEPLEMTFSNDSSLGITAADILNDWSEELIATILFSFSDERKSRTIARKIIEYRAQNQFKTVADVLIVVEKILGKHRRGKTHPATKTFQALRMAVNDEVGALEEALSKVLTHLKPGGRCSVISFHSVEDRIVKRFIREHATIELTSLSKKPIIPSVEELRTNPRSRSAKLRAFEKN